MRPLVPPDNSDIFQGVSVDGRYFACAVLAECGNPFLAHCPVARRVAGVIGCFAVSGYRSRGDRDRFEWGFPLVRQGVSDDISVPGDGLPGCALRVPGGVRRGRCCRLRSKMLWGNLFRDAAVSCGRACGGRRRGVAPPVGRRPGAVSAGGRAGGAVSAVRLPADNRIVRERPSAAPPRA